MTQSEESPARPLLRLAIEVGPLVAFFIGNAKLGLFKATAVFMVATVISLTASRLLEKRWPTMPLVTAFFVLIFGGLTLYLEDATFIKLKPTIVNTLFGVILLGGLATGRALLKPLLGTAVQLKDDGWRILTLRWAVFFFFLAVVNEIVWRNFSDDAWVNFKVFGIMPLTMVFAISQMSLLKRYELESEPAPEPEPEG